MTQENQALQHREIDIAERARFAEASVIVDKAANQSLLEGARFVKGKDAISLAQTALVVAQVELEAGRPDEAAANANVALKLIPRITLSEPERMGFMTSFQRLKLASETAGLLADAGHDGKQALNIADQIMREPGANVPGYAVPFYAVALAKNGRVQEALELTTGLEKIDAYPYTDIEGKQRNDMFALSQQDRAYKDMALSLLTKGLDQEAEEVITRIDDPKVRVVVLMEAANLEYKRGQDSTERFRKAVVATLALPVEERKDQALLLVEIAKSEQRAGRLTHYQDMEISGVDGVYSGDCFDFALKTAELIPSRKSGRLGGYDDHSPKINAILTLAQARHEASLNPDPAFASALDILAEFGKNNLQRHLLPESLQRIMELKIQYGMIKNMNDLRDILYRDFHPQRDRRVMSTASNSDQLPKYIGDDPNELTEDELSNDAFRKGIFPFRDEDRDEYLGLVAKWQIQAGLIPQANKIIDLVGPATKAEILQDLFDSQVKNGLTAEAEQTMARLEETHKQKLSLVTQRRGIVPSDLDQHIYLSASLLEAKVRMAIIKIGQAETDQQVTEIVAPVLEEIRNNGLFYQNPASFHATDYLGQYVEVARALSETGRDPEAALTYAEEDVETRFGFHPWLIKTQKGETVEQRLEADAVNGALIRETWYTVNRSPLVMIALIRAELGQDDKALEAIEAMPERYQDEAREKLALQYLSKDQEQRARQAVDGMEDGERRIRVLAAFAKYYDERSKGKELLTEDPQITNLLKAPEDSDKRNR